MSIRPLFFVFLCLSCTTKLKEISPVIPIKVVIESVSVHNDTIIYVESWISSVGEGATEYGHQYGDSSANYSFNTQKGKTSEAKTFRDTIIRHDLSSDFYLRAYARDRNGEVVSNPFILPSQGLILPEVETVDHEVMAYNPMLNLFPVVVEGNITELGNVEIIQHGHEWSITPTFNVISRTELGIVNEAGIYSSTINEIIPGKEYYIRAYVETSDSRYTSAGIQISVRNVWVKAGVNGPSIPARGNASTLKTGAKGFLGLGKGEGNVLLNDFWEYSLENDFWIQREDLPSHPRESALSFQVNGFGYMGTGEGKDSTLRDLWRYDTLSNSWSKTLDFQFPLTHGMAFEFSRIVPPNGSHLPSGAFIVGNYEVKIDENIYVYHIPPILAYWLSDDIGLYSRCIETELNQNFSAGFNFDDNSAGVSYASDVYLISKSPEHGNLHRMIEGRDSCSLSDEGIIMWGGSRMHATSFVIDSVAYVGLGSVESAPERGHFDDFYSYDPLTNIWTQIPSFPGGARTTAVSFVIKDEAYVGSGFDEQGNPTNDFWKYVPE